MTSMRARLAMTTATLSATDRARDPEDPMNGVRYRTGRPCIERDCYEPAGTAWGPQRCQLHNAEQLERISRSLTELAAPGRLTAH